MYKHYSFERTFLASSEMISFYHLMSVCVCVRVFLVDAKKAYGRVKIKVTVIHVLGGRERGLISFTPRPLYPGGNGCRYT